jgi:AraC-like DNA-binding protein
LAHLIDFWHEGAPSINLLAPDIYDTGFKSWCAQYAMPLRPQDGGTVKNRLFIPESRCCENSGVRALYAFGEHQALGFSPFAIDQASAKETESVTQAYNLLRQIFNYQLSIVNLKTWGLLFDQEDRERIIDDDGVVMTCRHYFTLPWDPRATDGSTWPEGGAIFIRLGKFDYLLAGSGVVIDFKTPTEKQQEQKKQLGEDGFAEAGGAMVNVPLDQRSLATNGTQESSMVNEAVERWIASGKYREHNLTLGIVARQMGIAQRQLQEWLRQSEYGKLAGLVTTLRIEEAKRVLKEHPEWSTESVADYCGFSSREYFHRTFRQMTGTTPANFQ